MLLNQFLMDTKMFSSGGATSVISSVLSVMKDICELCVF